MVLSGESGGVMSPLQLMRQNMKWTQRMGYILYITH